MRKKLTFLLVSVLLALPFVAGAVMADYNPFSGSLTTIPRLINYQGTLSNAGGIPLGGTYALTFRLYDAATGGTLLWGPETQDVVVDNGLFSVLLGSVEPLDPAVLASASYLEVEIGGEVLEPRQQLVSVAYALLAEQANTLSAGATISSTLSTALLKVYNGSSVVDSAAVQAYSSAGVGVSGDSLIGVGGTFHSDEGYALVVDSAAVLETNVNRIALLRWYDAIQTGTAIAVDTRPRGAAFDGENVWVANWAVGKVTKVDARTGAVVGVYSVGGTPWELAFDGTHIWVTDEANDKVLKLRADTGAVVGNYTVGDRPVGICFDGANLWVANMQSDEVTKVRARDGAVMGTYAVGDAPVGVAFDGTNVWVSNGDGDSVTRLRASDGAWQGEYAAGDSPAGLCFDGAYMWVANQLDGTVTKLRVSDGAEMGTYSSGGLLPNRIVFDGRDIWVTNHDSNTVARLDALDGALLGTYSSNGVGPLGICFDGANIWVTNKTSNTLAKL